ncbi:MAG: 50S ribosomal protein L24 [Zetaproteobacteria bacterium]|nr:MAG: 50S ribosomal protein L24 [Zetaproteobacteria bacterium]
MVAKQKRVKTHVRREDEVVVIAGKDKGARGKVLKVLPEEGRVVVAGVNIVKRHTKPGPNTRGGIIEREAPIAISNVLFYCPHCQRGVRLGRKFLEDGRKVRYCRKCGEVVDK